MPSRNGSGWDRTSPGYLAEWLPQFAPYDADFAEELAVRAGDVVLTTAGSEALAFARAVGESGTVHARDSRAEMRALCKERAATAKLAARVDVLEDGVRGPYDVIALAHADNPLAELRALRPHVTPNGKVGLMLWGPDADDDPERAFARTVEEIAPDAIAPPSARPPVERAALASLFESAGLALVRHTACSHAIVFPTAERFARALLGARVYGARLVALGEERVAAVLARFYERASGEASAITYAPSATIAVGGLPGAELELPHRPSVRIPK